MRFQSRLERLEGDGVDAALFLASDDDAAEALAYRELRAGRPAPLILVDPGAPHTPRRLCSIAVLLADIARRGQSILNRSGPISKVRLWQGMRHVS